MTCFTKYNLILSLLARSSLGAYVTTSRSIDHCANGWVRQEAEERNRNKRVIAKFSAESEATSFPVPLPQNGKPLDDFFRSVDHRNLLFSPDAGVEEIGDATMQMRGGSLGQGHVGILDSDDGAITSLVRVRNPVISFLGIKLTSSSTLRSRLLLGNRANGQANMQRCFPGFPELHFTVLDSSVQKGTETKSERKAASRTEQSDASGFTRIWAEPTGDGNMVFRTHAQVESHVALSRLMAKFLPSIKTIEQKGSSMVQKMVEKDIDPALGRFREAYLKWISS